MSEINSKITGLIYKPTYVFFYSIDSCPTKNTMLFCNEIFTYHSINILYRTHGLKITNLNVLMHKCIPNIYV